MGGMKNMDWLRVGGIVLGMIAWGGGVALAQSAAAAPAGTPDVLSQAEAFPVEQMTVRRTANGGESRNVVRGVLKTGEAVAVHESMQPAGAEPNPAHRIEHSEFIVVTEGTVEFDHDGRSERVGAGGVIYVAYGTMHRLRNVGNGPAKYVVVAIGGDTKK